MNYTDVIICVLSGLAVCIPLIVKLCKTVSDAIEARNWKPLISILLGLMQEAEEMYDCGLKRKEWVMRMVKNAAVSIDYDIDDKVLSELIDALCDMSKIVNA